MYHGTYISLIYLISSESILSDQPLMRVFYAGGRGIILDVGWDSPDLMPKIRYIHRVYGRLVLCNYAVFVRGRLDL